MRIAAEKTDLVESLTIANKAVSSRSSIQVLSGILLEAKTEGITLTATDMEISIRTPLRGRVEETGAVVLPARIVTDIAKNLASREVVIEQRMGENQMEVRSGESFFMLHSLSPADFPQLPVFPLDEGFSVEKSAFLETVDRVASSASRDETRPVLTGVLAHVTQNTVKMVATDSYRLSVMETPIEATVADKVQAIIPARSLTELSRIGAAGPADVIIIVPTENQVLFEVGGVWLISRLIDGQFPNYRQLLPESFDYEVTVDKTEFLEVVRRVGLLAQKNAPLRLRFSDNTLTVSAESQDVGKARESIPVRYEGDDLEIGFNPEFLEAGAAAVAGPTVHLKFISPLRPGLIKGEEDDFLYLIMPIRLSD
ncbi:MAG: DNA polymerase III subunit beta [Thermoleophilia bacterium]|nr:DNA polymerase III subunit beta [Thermoleophilia bacterium]